MISYLKQKNKRTTITTFHFCWYRWANQESTVHNHKEIAYEQNNLNE